MVDTEMLCIANINKPMVAPPAITMDDAIDTDISTNYLLQRRLTCIGNNLSIDQTITFEDTKYNRLGAGATPSFASNPARTKVRFINFYLTLKGAVKGAFLGESTANLLIDSVDRADADTSYFSGFGSWQIHSKQVQNFTKFALRNLRSFVVPVFSFHNSSLASF